MVKLEAMKAEKRLLGQNFTPGANSLPALVKHSGLMVLVCHCHVTSSAGCFVTEMVTLPEIAVQTEVIHISCTN